MAGQPIGLLAQLRRQRLWLAVGVIVASFCAASRFASISVLPPSIHPKQVARSTASTQVLAGGASSTTYGSTYGLPDRYLGNYSPRAEAVADIAASPQIRNDIARRTGLPASQINMTGPLWQDLQRAQEWATGQKRADQIVGELKPYQVTINNDSTAVPFAPVFNVVTEAPTTGDAARLARAVPVALDNYLRNLQNSTGIAKSGRYSVSQLSPVVVSPAKKAQLVNVGVFVFVSVFLLWCGLVLAVSSVMRDLRVNGASLKVRDAFKRSSGKGPAWPEASGPETSTG
jgi:hypothetical protein